MALPWQYDPNDYDLPRERYSPDRLAHMKWANSPTTFLNYSPATDYMPLELDDEEFNADRENFFNQLFAQAFRTRRGAEGNKALPFSSGEISTLRNKAQDWASKEFDKRYYAENDAEAKYRLPSGEWNDVAIRAANERDTFNNSPTVERLIGGQRVPGFLRYNTPAMMTTPQAATRVKYPDLADEAEAWEGPGGTYQPEEEVYAKPSLPFYGRQASFSPINLPESELPPFEMPQSWLQGTPEARQQVQERQNYLNTQIEQARDVAGATRGREGTRVRSDSDAAVQRLVSELKRIHGVQEPYKPPKERAADEEARLKDKNLEDDYRRALSSIKVNINGKEQPKYQGEVLASIVRDLMKYGVGSDKIPKDVIADLPEQMRVPYRKATRIPHPGMPWWPKPAATKEPEKKEPPKPEQSPAQTILSGMHGPATTEPEEPETDLLEWLLPLWFALNKSLEPVVYPQQGRSINPEVEAGLRRGR